MWHRLALEWSCTKYEAKQRCTIKEFFEWCAYGAVESFGEQRQDARIAILGANLASILSAGLFKRGRRFHPKDFSPQDAKPKQTQQEMMATMKQAVAKMKRVDHGQTDSRHTSCDP